MTTPPAGPGPAPGIDLRLLDGHEELSLACGVIDRVFGEPFPVDVLVAVQLAGGYVGGAYRGSELVGCAAGFAEYRPAGQEPALHSHVAAVLATARGLQIGRALKWHQRSWALERGIRTVHWTFDPLVRRNSHLNLNLLGADAVRYLPNLYGVMPDVLNGNQQTDRLLVSWELDSPRVNAAASGRSGAAPADSGATVLLTADDAGEPASVPPAGTPGGPDVPLDGGAGGPFLVGTPADIEALVADRPAVAARWREAQRQVLKPLVDKGYVVSGVTPEGFLIATAPAGDPPTEENR